MTNVVACADGQMVSEEVVEELLRFGYKTVQDIESDLCEYIDVIINEEESTLLGLFRDLMIIKDCNKYFSNAYFGDWQATTRESVNIWKKMGIYDIERYLRRAGIEIFD